MTELAPCPICQSPYTYVLESLLVYPECGHEWSAAEEPAVEEGFVVKDSNGH
ncbi:hypothetical protein [Mucilaginibacter ginsenosidivorax]|uniref:hypothetical protein n=1 Tax=Mucilaginibacter ginsenosidivorax TaxID=862126 RepID=UPI001CEF815E|nr:hypothetical protein [Mucilaginibacter ginsenosidivorax]